MLWPWQVATRLIDIAGSMFYACFVILLRPASEEHGWLVLDRLIYLDWLPCDVWVPVVVWPVYPAWYCFFAYPKKNILALPCLSYEYLPCLVITMSCMRKVWMSCLNDLALEWPVLVIRVPCITSFRLPKRPSLKDSNIKGSSVAPETQE